MIKTSAALSPPYADVDAPFARALLELGKAREEVVVLSADLSKYTDVRPFADAYPKRFIQVGMAEQNLLGIAGGLSRTGHFPIAVTYGVFATRRACDQLQMALAVGCRKALVVGFLPGITTPFRATHQATDDLAILRAVPAIALVDPLDATEMQGATRAAAGRAGLTYMRGLRGLVPRILAEGSEFVIGKTRRLRQGIDVGLIGTGLGTQWLLEAAEVLVARGMSPGILHVPTVKPLDAEAVRQFCRAYRAVIVVENHSIIGGLGSAVCEAVAERGLPVRVRRLGVPDTWGVTGPIGYIREHLGLTPESIASVVEGELLA